MKTLFTSMLLFVMTVSQALPVSVDSADKGKSTPTTTNPAPANSTMSMQQLQEENANLKARLAKLETTMENEKAMLEFKFTMRNVLVNFEDAKQDERLNQMEALANYNFVMGTTLLKIRNKAQ